MKRFLILLVMPVFLFSANVMAGGKLRAWVYDDIGGHLIDARFSHKYSLTNDMALFYYFGSGYQNKLGLNRIQRDELIQAIHKYEKWHKKAVQKKVTLEKKIREVGAEYFNWSLSDNVKYSSKQVKFDVYFSSGDVKTHYLILKFPRMSDQKKDYVKYSPGKLYFDLEGAQVLKENLSAKNIQKAIERYKKQKAIEDEFQ